ncbi:MAG: TlpA family protein disulfide reductase [Myxococcota bacterium]
MRAFAAGLLLILAAIAGVTACGGSPAPPEANLMPEISLEDLAGKEVPLSRYRGKILLVDFWATWCAPCEESIPHLVKLQERFRDQGFDVLGIALDVGGAKVVGPFVKKRKVNYPVLLGDEGTARAFGGIMGVPTSFIIDRDGRIVRRFTGVVDHAVYEDLIRTLL